MRKRFQAILCASAVVVAAVFGIAGDASPAFADSGESEYTSYVVKRGDTLWDIAERFLGDGSRYHEIAADNNIANPRLIFSGDRLLIRSTAETKTPAEIAEAQQARMRELEAHHQSTTALYEQHAALLAREQEKSNAIIAAQQDEAEKLRATVLAQEARNAALADQNEMFAQENRAYADSVVSLETVLKREEDRGRVLLMTALLVGALGVVLVIMILGTPPWHRGRTQGTPPSNDSETVQQLTKERDEARITPDEFARRTEAWRQEREAFIHARALIENPAALIAALSPDILLAVLKLAKSCPYCNEQIEAKNYVRHVEERCAKKPAPAPVSTP